MIQRTSACCCLNFIIIGVTRGFRSENFVEGLNLGEQLHPQGRELFLGSEFGGSLYQFNSIQFYFLNKQTNRCKYNTGLNTRMYVIWFVMIDKKHNMNDNNNKS